jgi:very-short-patch-repair endonuclease
LIVEIDGSSHNSKLEQDSVRQAYLEGLGLRVLRFQDTDVKRNLQGVLSAIKNWISENQPDSDS